MTDSQQSRSRWALSADEFKRLSKEAKAFKGESLWSDAWRRLRRNRAAFIALLFLGVFALVSLLAPFLPLPSPVALSLRSEPSSPEWVWSEPAAPDTAPDKGTGHTEHTLNLWNNGWRHRSIVRVGVPDEVAAESVRGRLAEVAGRPAVLEVHPGENPGEIEAFAAVPLLDGDRPRTDAEATDFTGSATVWKYSVPAEMTDDGIEAQHVVHALDLRNADGVSFDPESVSGWTLEQRGKTMTLFLERAEPVPGMGPWTVTYRLKRSVEETPTAVILNRSPIGESTPVLPSIPTGAQTVKAELFKGVEHPNLKVKLTESLLADPIPGIELHEVRHESGYWQFKGLVGHLDRALLRARIAVFGHWQTGNWLGTDGEGRDLLSRIVWGSRTSIIVGLIASFCSLLIGVLYGALSGFMGGRVDNLMMRIVDVLYSIPFIFVVIFLITVVGENRIELEDRFGLDRETIFYLVIGAIYWLTMARVVRGQVLSLKNTEFIEAARVIGASKTRIIINHLVPNVLSIVIVYLTLTIPAVMLFEAFLSFLGLGIEPPKVSWGLLAVDGTQAITPLNIYWWLVVFPALAMGSTLLALNVLGDGLRDALDPKQRGKS